jgi:hypothetical protein
MSQSPDEWTAFPSCSSKWLPCFCGPRNLIWFASRPASPGGGCCVGRESRGCACHLRTNGLVLVSTETFLQAKAELQLLSGVVSDQCVEKKGQFFFFWWCYWGLNSRLHLLSRASTFWGRLPALFALIIFQVGFMFCPGPVWTVILLFMPPM